MSSAKTTIYPNSLILEREVSAFLRKKGTVKNLPIGMAGLVRRGSSEGAGGRVRMKEPIVCGQKYVLICSLKERVATGR
jgi:hypothetical protein